MKEKSKNKMIFVKCPKCGDRLFIICENCHKSSEWELKGSEIECSCGEQYEGWLCECKTEISPKEFLFVDKELVIKKRGKLLDKRSRST